MNTDELQLVVNTQKVKIGRVTFPDGEDQVYLAALDRPNAASFSILSEYIPSWAVLNDIEFSNDIAVLTFEARQ